MSINRTVVFILFLAITASTAGCGTASKTSRSCKNGICKDVTTRCINGICTVTTCYRGNCVVTVEGEKSASKNIQTASNNKYSVSPDADTETVVAYKPTANHQVFISLINAQVKNELNLKNDTTATQDIKREKFNNSVFKKRVSFKKICLDDVQTTFMGGSYTATFYVPIKDCSEEKIRDYNAPVVKKENLCEKEIAKFKKGGKYDVSGKISGFQFSSPEDRESDVVKKYFFKGYNSITLDGTDYYRCVHR